MIRNLRHKTDDPDKSAAQLPCQQSPVQHLHIQLNDSQDLSTPIKLIETQTTQQCNTQSSNDDSLIFQNVYYHQAVRNPQYAKQYSENSLYYNGAESSNCHCARSQQARQQDSGLRFNNAYFQLNTSSINASSHTQKQISHQNQGEDASGYASTQSKAKSKSQHTNLGQESANRFSSNCSYLTSTFNKQEMKNASNISGYLLQNQQAHDQYEQVQNQFKKLISEQLSELKKINQQNIRQYAKKIKK